MSNYAKEFVVSEVMPGYWCVWWEIYRHPRTQLRCQIEGFIDPETAIHVAAKVADELGVKLPMLQRKGRNTT